MSEQKNFLSGMVLIKTNWQDEDMSSTGDMLTGTIGRFRAMASTQNGRMMLYMIMFVIVTFVFMYVYVKYFRGY